ncbi:helix-turn-helix transcriptional regulator [Methylacidiphilum caldifontis]|uniref:Uncharacterized protein n=1 Tax=Methylacidiphilum caldifontis TaxID=2795386 RepID=A0A4Y8PAF8_9BACT|nr:WYL domain-containing protein [Methylacidiphilum caldifontis]TFE67817.1 hypothetical protein A7Q10_09055 [Methylacidiphilum caldifontis]
MELTGGIITIAYFTLDIKISIVTTGLRLIRPIRLIQICYEIKTNPNRSPKEIYKALGISKQQFYKDKKLLEKLGFKFIYSSNHKSFIIEQDSIINIHDLKLSEIFALVMSVRQFAAIGDYVLTLDALNGIRKIINQAPMEIRDLFQCAFEDIVFKESFGCDPKILEILIEAIKENVRRLIIIYDNYKKGELAEYEFSPYMIFSKKNGLYVEGYSFTHKDYCMFRINRIKDIKIMGYIEPKRSDYSFKDRHKNSFGVFTGKEATKVKIRFSKRVAKYIQEPPWSIRGTITRLPEGEIVYEIVSTFPQEVLWWALQWGAEAEVLYPEWLRKEAIDSLKRSLEKYLNGKISEQVQEVG